MATQRPKKRVLGEELRRPIAPAWWPAATFVPILFGALWLWWASRSPWPGLLDLPPGILLLATGVSGLFFDRDPRLFQYMTFGAFMGMVLSLPAMFIFGVLPGLLLLVGSFLSFLSAGYLGVGQESVPAGAPIPKLNARLAFKAATDELTIGTIVWSTWPLTIGPRAERVRHEMEEAYELFDGAGWLDSPRGYHREPPPLENPTSRERRHLKHTFEQLSFESGYEPWPEEPGRERWLSYKRNRTAHAWVLRHPGEPRPWLVCVHGIRMGSPWKDLTLFKPDYLHEELGLNLLFPVLPIHGPRRVGLVSGGRVLTGDLMDTLHAASQAMWDIRRLLGWLELQEATGVGALGHSLGGYSAALLSCLDRRLDCVVVGNPATDFTRLFWRNTPALAARYMQHQGVWRGLQGELTKVISPLEMKPLLPPERRAIFGGVADRVVPISETNSLWMHWDKPRIAWYEGTHRGFLREPEARQLLKGTLHDAGLLTG